MTVQTLPAPNDSPLDAPAIELINAARWYGNVVAVNDVSFSLGAGVTGLLGPNGAGKTTLLHMLAGFLAPSAGIVRVLGRSPHGDPSVYRQIGLVPERESVYSFLSGYEYVRFNARLQGMKNADSAVRAAIARVGLEDAADRALGTYSKGMRQRAKVAGALVHDPQVLLLDEPFNGMDPRQRMAMMDLLGEMANAGRTILFSSHILEEVERVATEILVLVAGRLAASGDFRAIRALMTDRPHTITIRSSDDRKLATTLISDPAVFAVELRQNALSVQTSHLSAFRRIIATASKSAGVRLKEVEPADESLESVFDYLVRR
ncbi:MAG TPA: ABC transporter ATP-binding protein [Terriglobales bacterium]|nr:ABC transporter ATP-binding protein [Terriglobales bacterium]